MSLRTAFKYSIIESIFSRGFDLVTLWLVLSSLPNADISKFGLATASISFFNFAFFSPETSLLRLQKIWQEEETLSSYLSTFIIFSISKILIHLVMFLIAGLYFGFNHWSIYAIGFSAITQQIQNSEIARIYLRMDLQQKYVAKFEIISKFLLLGLCSALLFIPNLTLYFSIFFVWSVLASVYWITSLNKRVMLHVVNFSTFLNNLRKSAMGYATWTHIIGVLANFISNSSILFLAMFSVNDDLIALYTGALRINNLQMTLPMLLAAFVPVALANSGGESERVFNKIVFANAAFSILQTVVFLAVASYLATLFGYREVERDFYILCAIMSCGLLLLNLTRPLNQYSMINEFPARALFFVFVPSAIFAAGAFYLGVWLGGIQGLAWSVTTAYAFLSFLQLIAFFRTKRNKTKNTIYSTEKERG